MGLSPTGQARIVPVTPAGQRALRLQPRPQPDHIDVARWQRKNRHLAIQRVLQPIPETTLIAKTIGVAPSTVRRWRASTHSPTRRNCQRVRALGALLLRGAR
jgi:hypothetical protein